MIPFEHKCVCRAVLMDRRAVNVEIRNFGRSRDVLVIITQPAQLIRNFFSFSFIDGTLLQNLNPRLTIDQTEPLEDLPHPND